MSPLNISNVVKFSEGAAFFNVMADGTPRLLASQCQDCGHTAFPPKKVCADCFSEEQVQVELSTEGTLVAATIVQMPPAGFAHPYAVGYVDFPEGVRIFSQITSLNPAHLQPGTRVKLALISLQQWDEKTVVAYGFCPIEEVDLS